MPSVTPRRPRRLIAALIAVHLVVALAAVAVERGDTGRVVCPEIGALDGEPRWERGTVGARAGFSPGSAIFGVDDADLACELDGMAALGVRWIRLDVDWSRVEEERGELDWGETDRLIEAARARGLDVIALITYTPRWARPDGTRDKHPPERAEDFARFAALAADRYRPLGVHTFEIWNEPNIQAFWQPRPDPQRYAQLLRAASPAIREVHPEATVLSGGLAPAVDADDGDTVAPATFLRRAYDAGAGQALDAVAVHPYSWPALPLDPASASYNTFLRLPEVRDVMEDNGDADKQIWLTEAGAPTGSGRNAVSEHAQGETVRQLFEGAAARTWIGPVLWYAYRDPGEDPGDVDDSFGLVRRDFRAKPALDVFADVAGRPSRR